MRAREAPRARGQNGIEQFDIVEGSVGALSNCPLHVLQLTRAPDRPREELLMTGRSTEGLFIHTSARPSRHSMARNVARRAHDLDYAHGDVQTSRRDEDFVPWLSGIGNCRWGYDEMKKGAQA